MEFTNIADLTNPDSGKTFRQENNEMNHNYKVDDLVEIIFEDSEYEGMRLYIIGCVRDCDGTPLYVLGSKGTELYQQTSMFTPVKPNSFYNFKSFTGFGENSLKLIKSA